MDKREELDELVRRMEALHACALRDCGYDCGACELARRQGRLHELIGRSVAMLKAYRDSLREEGKA